MAASRVRSTATKRSEWWSVAKDRSNPAKGRKVIRKVAVRNSNGTFVGATNYRPADSRRQIKGTKIEG